MTVPDDPDMEIAFVNLNVQAPPLAIERGWLDELELMGDYVTVDSLFGQPSNSRIYTFYFSMIPAKTSYDILVRVKATRQAEFPVQVFVSNPFYQSPLSPSVQGCIAFAIVKALVKSGISIIPGGPCILGAFSVVSQALDDDPPTPSAFDQVDVKSWHWNLGTALLECGLSINPATYPLGTVLSIITNMVDLKQEHEDCLRGYWPSPISIFQILYYVSLSRDPNEKNGVIGHGEENYIPATGRMSYQILFENVDTATANAQEVWVRDTLSPVFNFDDFDFGPFGFGDSTYFPVKDLDEFAHEIDLRPQHECILRVNGKFDRSTGVVEWYFASLHPESKDIVYDPDAGFLPPNVTSPEGEGFVSFTCGLKTVTHDLEVNNEATIIFDFNEPIVTNNVRHTFDLAAPVSSADSDVDVVQDTSFTIMVDGSDPGTGIRFYEVYVSKDDGAFSRGAVGPGLEFTFYGEYGHRYGFFSIAVDSVGNQEAMKAAPETEVTILTGTSELPDWATVSVQPNPNDGQFVIWYTLSSSRSVRASLKDVQGKEVWGFNVDHQTQGQYTHQVDLDLVPGVYFLDIRTDDAATRRRILVQ